MRKTALVEIRSVIGCVLFITVQARLIGVPGELKAYRLAHNLYGHLPWKSLFEPTIKMIREGFPLSPATARALKVAVARGTKLQDHPVFW